MLKKLGLLLFGSVIAFGLVACDEAEIEKVDKDNNEESENVTANENDETGENANDSEASKEEASKEEADEELTVGDTVDFDGLEITLNEARIEEGGDFDEPEEDLFVVANLTIENTGDDEQAISSIMNMELKDDEGYSYHTTFLMEGTKGQLDGEIEPGGKMRGEIPFDVADSETYELHFSDPFKSGKAIWLITNLE